MNSSEVYKMCMLVFDVSQNICGYFILLFFLMRVSYGFFTGEGPSGVASSLKGVVAFFILTYSFEFILDLVLKIPDEIQSYNIVGKRFVRSNSRLQEEVPTIVFKITAVISSVIHHVATFINLSISVFLSAYAPIVFLMSSMFKVGIGLGAFYGTLVITSTWPIIEKAFDLLSSNLNNYNVTGFAGFCFETCIYVFKILLPFYIAKSALSFASTSSDGAASRAISTAGRIGINAIKGQFPAAKRVNGPSKEPIHSNSRNRNYSGRKNWNTYVSSEPFRGRSARNIDPDFNVNNTAASKTRTENLKSNIRFYPNQNKEREDS